MLDKATTTNCRQIIARPGSAVIGGPWLFDHGDAVTPQILTPYLLEIVNG
jgi:hypothetical protein